MTVPKSTTPEVPLLAPFIVMPVIVPVFFVYPRAVMDASVGISFVNAIVPLESGIFKV